MGLGESFLGTMKSIIYGPSGTRESVYVLPEHLRNLSEGNVNPNQIIDIAATSSFDLYGLSLALKSLRQNTNAQRELLSYFLNTVQSMPDVSGILRVFFGTHPELKTTEVSAEKLAKIAFWDPKEYVRRSNEVASEVKTSAKTPVIILYSGIFALTDLIDNLGQDNSLYILDPARMQDLSIGFRVNKAEGKYVIEDVGRSELLSVKNAALIDDSSHTGETFSTVSSLFPSGSVTMYPFFDLPFQRTK